MKDMNELKKNKPNIRFPEFTDDWEQRKLGDIIDKLTGGASIAPDDYTEEGYRTIPKGAVNDTGVADMSGCKCVSEAFFMKNISSKTSTGELVTSLRDLVPTAPNMGRIVRIYGDSEDFLMPQGVYSIVLKKDSDEDFLIAYSNSPDYRKIIATEKNGSTQVHIRNGEFLNIDIPVPTYDEQKRIGATIKNLDNLITLHQRKCDKLRDYKAGMLQKLFPKNSKSVPEIRFPGFTDAWEQRKLSELVDVMDGDRGKNYPIESDFDTNGHTLFLNASNVTTEGFLFNDNQYISEEKSNSMGNGKLNEDDIVVTSRGSLGHIAWYNAEILRIVPFARINSGMLILRKKENISTSYLYQFMKSHKGQDQISFMSFGSAQPQLTKKGMENLLVEYPCNLDEQYRIGEYFANLDNLITLHQHKCDILKELKRYMLQNMFP